MSIEQKCRLKWSDIETLYESLDSLKNKFPEAKVTTIPEKEKKRTISQHIEDLNTAVEKVKKNKYVGDKAETNLTFPLKGRIKPLYLITIRNVIDSLGRICAHDSSYCPSHCGSDGGDCSQRNCDSGYCSGFSCSSDGGRSCSSDSYCNSYGSSERPLCPRYR